MDFECNQRISSQCSRLRNRLLEKLCFWVRYKRTENNVSNGSPTTCRYFPSPSNHMNRNRKSTFLKAQNEYLCMSYSECRMVQITNCLCLKGLPRGCKSIGNDALYIFAQRQLQRRLKRLIMSLRVYSCLKNKYYFFFTNICVDIIIFILK